MNTDLPSANWPSDILQQYLEDVQKDHDAGVESDEAVFCSDSSDNEMGVSSSDASIIDFERAADIASDDSAFSNEDSTDEDQKRKQSVGRTLVLGRPDGEVLELNVHELAALHEEYMKKLDKADGELAALGGSVTYAGVARQSEGEHEAEIKGAGDEDMLLVAELRRRSDAEILETNRKTLLVQLVALAVAHFRRTREIKRLQKEASDVAV